MSSGSVEASIKFDEIYDGVSSVLDGKDLNMVTPMLAYLLAECTADLSDGGEDKDAVKMVVAMYLDAYKRIIFEVGSQQDAPQGVTLN